MNPEPASAPKSEKASNSASEASKKPALKTTNKTAHRIVFANEKGGTGKSTTAVHVAVALSYLGAHVTALDLDPRQRTTHRYMENRFRTMQRRDLNLPTPACEVFKGRSPESLLVKIDKLEKDCDFLIIDNPGRDDPLARAAVEQADTLVTPMNDSFVDFDLIGQVDPENFKVKKLSFFAELIWEARLKRSKATIEQKRPEMDWVVVRNRTGYTEARNMARIERALTEMSKRVGFRVVHGLSERVIYRELFPSGLTLLDKGHLGELGTSHLVARQELRTLLKALNLPEFVRGTQAMELA
ncbi:MAG: division plane positioning ATPase MipZ [Pseudomonadota bacterium]